MSSWSGGELKNPLKEARHLSQEGNEESPEGASSPWSGGELKNPLKDSHHLGQEGD